MAMTPALPPLAGSKCGNTSTYKLNTSKGSTLITCVNGRNKFRIEVTDGRIYGVS